MDDKSRQTTTELKQHSPKPSKSGERLAVVVCTKDRPADLQRFLATFVDQNEYPEELLIIDAGTTAKVRALVTSFDDRLPISIKYHHTPPNLIRQRQLGIAATACEIICFFDDDVLLEKDCLSEIRRGFVLHPEIGGLTGRQLNVSRRLFTCRRSYLELPLRYLFFVAYDHGNGRFRFSGEGARVFADEHSHYLEVLSGCFMCYRRDALQQINLDVAHPFWREDVMISYQVAQKFQNLYWPSARLTHHHSSVARNLDTYEKYRQLIYSKYYQRRTILRRGVFRDLAFRLSVIGHILLRLSYGDFRGIRGIFAGRREARLNTPKE